MPDEERILEYVLQRYLHKEDVQQLAADLDLAVSGSKDEVVQRLLEDPDLDPADVTGFLDKEFLKRVCDELELDDRGTAQELRERVSEAIDEDERLRREKEKPSKPRKRREALRTAATELTPKSALTHSTRELTEDVDASLRPCPTCGAWNARDWLACQRCKRQLPPLVSAPSRSRPPPTSESTTSESATAGPEWVSVATALRNIMDHEGEALVNDPRRVKALLGDLCPGSPSPVRALVAAVEIGIPQDLRAMRGRIPTVGQLHRLVQDLSSKQSMIPEVARWAVNTWASVITPR